MKIKKRKKIWIAGSALAAGCAAGAAGIWLYQNRESGPEMPRLPEGMELSENVITASGLTATGMSEESWELGFLEDGLYVEETYLNLGDEVEAGTAVFQVSEDSLENARQELNKAVTETSLSRREGEISYQTGLIEAEKERDLAAAEAAYAQTVYDNAVKEAQDSLDDVQEQVDEAARKVEEYTASIEEDYYYTYYEVGELEAVWKENATLLMELYESWDVDSLEGIFGGSGGKNGIGYVSNQVTASTQMSQGTASGASSGASSGLSGDSSSGLPSDVSAPEGGSFFSQDSVVRTTSSESGASEASSQTGESGDGNGGESSSSTGDSSGESPSSEGETSGGESSSGEESSSEEESSGQEEDSEEEESPSGEGTSGEESPSQEEGGERPEGDRPSFGGGFGGAGGGTVSGNGIPEGGMTVNVGDDEIKYNIWLALEEETEESESAYEEALEAYETAKEQAEAGIAQAQNELAVLNAQLEEEKIAYEQAVIEAQQEYDMAMANQESAQTVYETAVKQLEEDLSALRDEEETAAENLELFEEVIGDGTFYTDAAGTVVMNNVRRESWLTEDTVVLAFSSLDSVSVAASIAQENIADISIGDEVWVAVSGYGTFTGKVTSFNPVSSSGSNSSVTYTVNVELEGDVGGLESNLTAYVYFGLTEEERELLEQSANAQGREGAGNGEDQPSMDGVQMPEGIELPEAMEIPEGMELPEGMEAPGGDGMTERSDRSGGGRNSGDEGGGR